MFAFFLWQTETRINNRVNYLLKQNTTQNTDFPLIDKIEKDCGSTFLVRYSSDKTKWWVFKSVCVEGNFCRFDYLKLEDCLK
jgi:hypothetical protein